MHTQTHKPSVRVAFAAQQRMHREIQTLVQVALLQRTMHIENNINVSSSSVSVSRTAKKTSRYGFFKPTRSD